MEDTDIIVRYWKRDETALTATSEKYGGYCYTIAFQVLNEPNDTEETVNDTYWELWNSIPPHRPQWLCAFIGKITRRLAISRLRHKNAAKRGGGEYAVTLDELSECIPDHRDPATAIESQQITAVVNRFLHGLPTTERSVFVCRYWYMMPVKKIAGQYRFSESKVKSMLLRTRQKLKRILTKEEWL